jgi:hypothetical protein
MKKPDAGGGASGFKLDRQWEEEEIADLISRRWEEECVVSMQEL